jgi:hypothetical protein
MEQIVYTSIATDSVTSAELFKIIEVSARNNPGREITGFLIATQNSFFQLVEGPAERLGELIEVLQRDPRHRDIRIQLREPIRQRDFPSWRMQRFNTANGEPHQILAIMRERRVRRQVLTAVECFLLAQRRAA